MNIRFIGINELGRPEVVNRIFPKLTDFDFIKSVSIREYNNSCGEALRIYDVTIEIKPDRDDVSIHIFNNSFYIVGCGGGCRNEAFIHIDRSSYERLEII